MRRLISIACGLSLFIAALLVIAIILGSIAPTEYVWARRGTLVQVLIRAHGIQIHCVRQWPSDEPLRHSRKGETVTVFAAVSGVTQWDFWLGQLRDACPVTVLEQGLENHHTIRRRSTIGLPLADTILDLLPKRCLAPALLLPIGWFVYQLISRRRWHPGLCRRCLYDLRVSTGRCPECGASSNAADPPL